MLNLAALLPVAKPASQPVKHVLTDSELTDRLALRLQCRLSGQVRELLLTTLSDGLLLQGCVTSYYAKLVVHGHAIELSGINIAVDEIVIV